MNDDGFDTDDHPAILRLCGWAMIVGFLILFWGGLFALVAGCLHVPTDALPPVVTPTTQPAVATGDAIIPESIRTKGSRANLKPQNARIKPGLNLTVRHTARGIAFDYAPHGWTGGETVARIYCAYQIGGEWIGGHWDDVRPGQKFKERKNLTGFVNSQGHAEGPRFGSAPPDGATVVYWLSNLANTERTEIVVAVNKWGAR